MKVFFTIYGSGIHRCGGHLGHVTSIMLMNFRFLVPKSFIQNLVKNGSMVSEKKKKKKKKKKNSYVNDPGPRSRYDNDYSHAFIYYISCLNLPTFRSQAAIVSEKIHYFPFFAEKTYVTKFYLAVK